MYWPIFLIFAFLFFCSIGYLGADDSEEEF